MIYTGHHDLIGHGGEGEVTGPVPGSENECAHVTFKGTTHKIQAGTLRAKEAAAHAGGAGGKKRKAENGGGDGSKKQKATAAADDDGGHGGGDDDDDTAESEGASGGLSSDLLDHSSASSSSPPSSAPRAMAQISAHNTRGENYKTHPRTFGYIELPVNSPG